jgi:hypothetical protein
VKIALKAVREPAGGGRFGPATVPANRISAQKSEFEISVVAAGHHCTGNPWAKHDRPGGSILSRTRTALAPLKLVLRTQNRGARQTRRQGGKASYDFPRQNQLGGTLVPHDQFSRVFPQAGAGSTLQIEHMAATINLEAQAVWIAHRGHLVD